MSSPKSDRRLCCTAALIFCGLLFATDTGAQEPPKAEAQNRTFSFDLSEKPLAEALRDYAQITGQDLLFTEELVSGLTAVPLRGDFTAEEALRRLLDETGLSVERTAAGALMIRRIEYEETVTVTGTHIRGIPPESSALIVIDQEEIARSGVTTIDQLMRRVPQNFASLDEETFQGNTGDIQASANSTRGATVDLRGLGAGATLVLVNGHRVAPSGAFGAFVDVSMIPLSAIELVEVLTDGASALYGADAVGGVVNFILKQDFSGAETTLRYGRTGTRGLDERKLSQLLGHSWSSGNAMLVYEDFRQDELLVTERDFIPDQGGPFTLIPGQERRSVLTTMRQELGPELELSAEGFYSERDFEQDATVFGFFLTEESGGAETYGGAASLSKTLPADWAVTFTGNYATTRELRSTLFPPDPTPSIDRTKTDLFSGDLLADGPLWATAGGSVRASIGLNAREERFGDDDGDFSRRVNSAYGELFIPLVGVGNPGALARRLELALAGRYDDYDDVGSSFNPKVGVLWEPITGVRLRGTYGTSFRAPPIPQLRTDSDSYFVLGIPNPQGTSTCPQPAPLPPAPCSITLVTASPWNPGLDPEESRSLSFGIDVTVARVPGVSASVTYFDINFDDRIASPPLPFGLFGLYAATDVVAPFLDFSPDPAEVARIFADEDVLNLAGVGPSDVEVFFDGRLQNLAKTKTSGLDLLVKYERPLAQSRLSLFASTTYLLERSDQAASTTPEVEVVDTIYNPPRLRARAGGGWTWGSWSSALTLNYTDSYENNLISPAGEISSWTTADLQIAWRLGDDAMAILRGMSVVLDIINFTDERPPRVSGGNNINLGFDPTNASPRGRFIALQIGKRW